MNQNDLMYKEKFIIPVDFTFVTKIPNFSNLTVVESNSIESQGVRTDYFEYDNGFKICLSSGASEITVQSNVRFKEIPTKETKTIKIEFDAV